MGEVWPFGGGVALLGGGGIGLFVDQCFLFKRRVVSVINQTCLEQCSVVLLKDSNVSCQVHARI